MAIHRLSIDEFDEVDYNLVAIHTSLEDYHLAYFINQKLPVILSKNKNEIQANTKDGEARFSRFSYENHEHDMAWNLIQNKNEIMVRRKSNGNLFDADEMSARVYLLPEFKKVDYFLKIENAEESVAEIISGIHTIARVSTTYLVNASQIKSKNNLIF